MSAIREFGKRSIPVLEDIGLMIIALATLVAMGSEVMTMVKAAKVTLADLLLMFIYLEVLTMIVIYLGSGKLPIRIPIYIAIVALARYLILDMKGMDSERMLIVAASVLILAVAVLVIRYGHTKYAYDNDE